jgi:arylsulfatase A-like enzyme
MHEGGIATPMIARWPDGIAQRGKLTHQPGHVIDVMATCLEVAKLQYPSITGGLRIQPIEGKSLLPILQGKTRQPSVLFWEHEGNRAVRDGKWKLVSRYPGKWELYDMEADRTELNDMAKRFPVIVADLSGAYAVWAKRCGVAQWRK